MKHSIIILSGLLILGICMIISSIIFSNSINNLTTQSHTVQGSLGVTGSLASGASSTYNTKTDFIAIGEVSRLLRYKNINTFTQDVLSGKIGNLPYINIDGRLVFSRTALEEWLAENARQNKNFQFD